MSLIDQADRLLMDNKAPVITEAMQAEQTRELHAALDQLGATALRIRDERDAMAKALRAVLLFHSGCHWTPDVRSDWKELTGYDEATTRTLCNTSAPRSPRWCKHERPHRRWQQPGDLSR